MAGSASGFIFTNHCVEEMGSTVAVSYTHLDVYKRQELGCEKIPVFAVTTHDTASAVVSASLTESSAYISCGTWSLMGVELQKPVITKESDQCGITNEIGHSATAVSYTHLDVYKRPD